MENLKKVLAFIQPEIEKKKIFQIYLESVLAISENKFSSFQEVLNRSKSLNDSKLDLKRRLDHALKTKELEVRQNVKKNI